MVLNALVKRQQVIQIVNIQRRHFARVGYLVGCLPQFAAEFQHERMRLELAFGAIER